TTGWGNELPDEMRIYRVDGAFQEITDAVARFRYGLRALYRFDYPDGFGYSSGPNPFSMVTCGVPRRTAQRFSSWSGRPQWLPRRPSTARRSGGCAMTPSTRAVPALYRGRSRRT